MFFARAASKVTAHQITNRLFYTERGQLLVSCALRCRPCLHVSKVVPRWQVHRA